MEINNSPVNNDLQLLALAFAQAASSGGQMTPGQYFRIAAELLRRVPCRLLVFGAGRDTELYVQANASGRTVVLEHHAAWAERVRSLGYDVIPVSYSTQLKDGLIDPCPPPAGVPDWVLHEAWDVILIDGPEGYLPEHPGRQQSIALAVQRVRPGATVFLHDADRPHERRCAARHLKEPDEEHGRQPTLAVFRYPPPPPEPPEPVE